MSTNPTASVFGTPALDSAFCGVSAGIVSTVCMQPLDLLKVQLQVSTAQKSRGALNQIWWGLGEIVKQGGVQGLYRGLTPNLVGNASSWGFYFLWYSMIKARMEQDKGAKLNAGQHLLASATSGVITAFITNPIWVVKTRMFTTHAAQERAYRGVWHGLSTLAREEGFRGMSKGMTLALIGVSNGAIQFMTYEELKKRRVELRRKRIGAGASDEEIKRLSNTEYILMSGSAKLVAIAITYPYQVIRSRIQYQPIPSPSPASSASSSPFSASLATASPSSATITTTTTLASASPSSRANPATATARSPRGVLASAPTADAPYRSIPDVIRRTYAREGLSGFYKGIATNAVRILPGTCVTFVVYEQMSRFLGRIAEERQKVQAGVSPRRRMED
ncbi:putative flavin-adenine dinucleotide transporter [Rhodotorula sp. JG-1b]|nr:putative flavin-adenine dinucleotide transporter [Rhodotorula sp. JG-1b]